MPIYSHSRLQTFETCPLKYKFRYLDKVETPIEETVETFVGSRVHETLEKLYKDLQLEKSNSLAELLDFYHAEWKKEWNPTVKITRQGYSEQNYRDYGAKCVRQYYERHKPFNESQTLATEMRLRFALDEQNQYKMTGIIDRAARRPDGTFEIHDYKTSREPPSQDVVDRDRQLALYQIGLRQKWPEAERVELLWHYLGCDMTLRSARTPGQLNELRQSAIRTINQIEAEKEFKPERGAWCDWCEFQPVCPLWKHELAVKALPAADFAADEGVKLANEIARTKRELDLLNQRYEQLKDLIAEYCRQHNLCVVAGSGVRVSVKNADDIRFPAKHEPARQRLEDLLHQLGRWDDVAGLDILELKRAVKERLWPNKDLAQIEAYAARTTATQVTVRRVKGKEEEEP
jgi:putative RecB family exonuclease